MIFLFFFLSCLQFHAGQLPNAPTSYPYMTIDDTVIRYDVQGEGPVVVMLHGYASSLNVWDRVHQEMITTHKIVRLDLKGFGWSSRPEGDYSPKAQAEIVWKLLQKLEIQNFDLVAHSWGSSVALQMALMDATRINKIALYDAWVYEEQLPAFFVWARVPTFGETLFRMWYKERIDDRMAMAFYRPQDVFGQEFVDHVESTLERPGAVAAALASARGQKYTEIQKEYKNIDVPVLLLWGEQDAVSPMWVAEQLAYELPKAQLQSFGSCGHFPMIEAFGPSTIALQKFLSEDF